MSLSSKIRVAVLRGGPSSEYDVSLQTGTHILQNLPEKYFGIDIFIDHAGTWHLSGLPKSPSAILHQSDVVFNALHGTFGEDGQLQRILESHSIPFTGSKSFPASLSMNKIFSKELFTKHDLKTPQYVVIKSNDNLALKVPDIFKTFVMPAIVKPASAGSSIGVSLVRTIPELAQAIEKAFEYGDTVLIEEYIIGKEASCGVIEHFRGEKLHALMPVEIRIKNKNFFDYDAKYTPGEIEEICPGNFFQHEKKMIEEYAQRAHQVLGLRHYSRSDFIVTPKRGIYILETNSLPGLTENSLMPKSLHAGGTSMSHFLDHVLTLAMEPHR